MIGGSDEHGVPITLRGEEQKGLRRRMWWTVIMRIIKKSFEEFGISFDIYSRTTSATHTPGGVGVSSVPYTIKESLSRKQANSITTRRQNSSLPTVI